ncbi:zinc finger MYM-type protein 1-like [Montipora foliosa]|uniref:zinc finger MYM-type protein 1-like n=1 Tax=Montipora foliosa TaxID=591990 RepID=UPI0035F1522F
MENPTATIQFHISTEREKRIKENRKLLQLIAKAVLYCGRQCIALRGEKERLDQPGNPRVAEADVRRQRYACTAFAQRQQGNIHFPRITQDILDARFCSILADESTSHNEEKLTIVIRFVDSNMDIREEFIDFKSLERTTGAAISNSILECLRDLNIPITDCRGQGYDGAAAMSSERVGVQAEIADVRQRQCTSIVRDTVLTL